MNFTGMMDKLLGLGTVVGALRCAACFPVLTSIGATLGLGFLAGFEGVLLNTLLPLFASLSLLVNLYAGLRRKYSLPRTLAGVSGPLMVLATLYLFWSDDWGSWMLYAVLVSMLLVMLWDAWSPVCHRCIVNIATDEVRHGH